MKEVITINLSGRLIRIEKDAAESLNEYLKKLKVTFAKEEGGDEILADIEYRIAELLQADLNSGAVAISLEHIQAIKAKMGMPEELNDEESIGEETKTFSAHKRLTKSNVGKMAGGVCSGMAAFFGVDVTVVRVLWIIFALSAGVGIFIYILLYFILPSSNDTAPVQSRKLFRDMESGYIAGVCAGIAHYLKINVFIVRLVFGVPVGIALIVSMAQLMMHGWPWWGISFHSGLILVYIVLAVVIPQAITDFDRMDMHGEEVNLESIKNNIKEQISAMSNGIKTQVKTWEQDWKQEAKKYKYQNKSNSYSSEYIPNKPNIITITAKIATSFISVIVLIVLAMFLFGVAINHNIIQKAVSWLDIDAFGVKLLLISLLLAIFAVVLGIVRLFVLTKQNKVLLRSLSIAKVLCWIVSIFMVSFVATNIAANHQDHCQITEEYSIQCKENRQINFVSSNNISNVVHTNAFGETYYLMVHEDSLVYAGIKYTIVHTNENNNTIKVKVRKNALGATATESNTIANNLKFNYQTTDTTIALPMYITLYKPQKFKGQYINVELSIPYKINVNDAIHQDGFRIP